MYVLFCAQSFLQFMDLQHLYSLMKDTNLFIIIICFSVLQLGSSLGSPLTPRVMIIHNTCFHSYSLKINLSCLHFSLGILCLSTPEFGVGIIFETICVSSLFITVYATAWMCVNMTEEFSGHCHFGTMLAFSVQRSADKNCIKFEIGTVCQTFIDTVPPWG